MKTKLIFLSVLLAFAGVLFAPPTPPTPDTYTVTMNADGTLRNTPSTNVFRANKTLARQSGFAMDTNEIYVGATMVGPTFFSGNTTFSNRIFANDIWPTNNGFASVPTLQTPVGTGSAYLRTFNGAGLQIAPGATIFIDSSSAVLGTVNSSGLSLPGTNAFTGNGEGLSNLNFVSPLVKIDSTVNGSLGIPIRLNNTNLVANAGAKHITVTNSAIITSTDGAFAGLGRGYQLEFSGNNLQLTLVGVASTNSAVAYMHDGSALAVPYVYETNETNWVIRPPAQTWSDDTIGAENYGGFMDQNGMLWFAAVSDQGQTYYLNYDNGTVCYVGAHPEANVGLSTGNGMVWAVGGERTNSASGSPEALQLFVHSHAPNESLGILPSGIVAVGAGAQGDGTHFAGFTNRHGSTLPFWSPVELKNGISGDGGGLSNVTAHAADATLSADIALSANNVVTSRLGNSNNYNGTFTGTGSGLTALTGANVTGSLTNNTTGNSATATYVTTATLTNKVSASNVTANGVITPAALGSGSGGNTKFLREDSTFQTVSTVTPTNTSSAAGVVSGSGAGIGTNITGVLTNPISANTGDLGITNTADVTIKAYQTRIISYGAQVATFDTGGLNMGGGTIGGISEATITNVTTTGTNSARKFLGNIASTTNAAGALPLFVGDVTSGLTAYTTNGVGQFIDPTKLYVVNMADSIGYGYDDNGTNAEAAYIYQMLRLPYWGGSNGIRGIKYFTNLATAGFGQTTNVYKLTNWIFPQLAGVVCTNGTNVLVINESGGNNFVTTGETIQNWYQLQQSELMLVTNIHARNWLYGRCTIMNRTNITDTSAITNLWIFNEWLRKTNMIYDYVFDLNRWLPNYEDTNYFDSPSDNIHPNANGHKFLGYQMDFTLRNGVRPLPYGYTMQPVGKTLQSRDGVSGNLRQLATAGTYVDNTGNAPLVWKRLVVGNPTAASDGLEAAVFSPNTTTQPAVIVEGGSGQSGPVLRISPYNTANENIGLYADGSSSQAGAATNTSGKIQIQSGGEPGLFLNNTVSSNFSIVAASSGILNVRDMADGITLVKIKRSWWNMGNTDTSLNGTNYGDVRNAGKVYVGSHLSVTGNSTNAGKLYAGEANITDTAGRSAVFSGGTGVAFQNSVADDSAIAIRQFNGKETFLATYDTTGAPKPMAFYVGGINRIEIGTTGIVAITNASLIVSNIPVLYGYNGLTNIGNLSTALTIQIGHTLANTNYFPVVALLGSALAASVTPTISAITTTSFDLNLSAGITGGANVLWQVISKSP